MSLNFVNYLHSYFTGETIETTVTLLENKHSNYHENQNLINQIKKIKEIQKIPEQSQIIDFCQISTQQFATAQKNGNITIWKLPYFEKIFTIQHGVECTSLASILDDDRTQLLLSSGRNNDEFQIYIWNLEMRKLVGDVIGYTKPLRKIIALANTQIAWCQDDSIIRMWKLNEKQQVNQINNHSAWINDLCRISQTLIASCSRDFTVAVIDYINGKTKYIIKDVTYVNCLSYINEDIFAFANNNGVVKIYYNEAPIQCYELQVVGNWIDSIGIFTIIRISEGILGVAAANGDIIFLNIERNKEQIIRTLQVTKNRICELITWIPNNKFFITTCNNDLLVLQ